MKTCKQCKIQFEITDADRAFYNKMDVPEPTHCPACRWQRRLAFKNNWNYYQNKCAHCGKNVISIYSPNKDRVVYCQACWWSDEWDQLEYGRAFDFSKTFTEQFAELLKKVPHVAMLNSDSENCAYTHNAANNKNCYMMTQSSHNEEVYYSFWSQKCKNSVDTSFDFMSEYCYDSSGLETCYGCRYSHNCVGCTESYFLLNCSSCLNCFGCVNMRNKQYCIFNEQKTKFEYEDFIRSMELDTWSGVQKAAKKAQEFALTQPRKFAEVHHIENSTGDYMHRAKNCTFVFDGYDIENVSYAEHAARDVKDCMDIDSAVRGVELCYEGSQVVINVYNCKFSFTPRQGSSNLEYCYLAVGCNECFGCVNIRKKEYCIFNKQYTKEEYFDLKKKIVTRMRKTGEYGEFFNPSLASCGYNETPAQEQFPLNKESALAQGFLWEDNLPGTFGKETLSWKNVPESIVDVQEEITKEIFACEKCAKNFKIIAQELLFYKKQGIPVPRLCSTCRFETRSKFRNIPKLWHRQCMCTLGGHNHGSVCTNGFETSYAPEQLEKVYCEECYIQVIG